MIKITYTMRDDGEAVVLKTEIDGVPTITIPEQRAFFRIMDAVNQVQVALTREKEIKDKFMPDDESEE